MVMDIYQSIIIMSGLLGLNVVGWGGGGGGAVGKTQQERCMIVRRDMCMLRFFIYMCVCVPTDLLTYDD
jgi:hypothetical protein